jgi:hypothetical protein
LLTFGLSARGQLDAMRRPNESYSDVIVRLAEIEAS